MFIKIAELWKRIASVILCGMVFCVLSFRVSATTGDTSAPGTDLADTSRSWGDPQCRAIYQFSSSDIQDVETYKRRLIFWCGAVLGANCDPANDSFCGMPPTSGQDTFAFEALQVLTKDANGNNHDMQKVLGSENGDSDNSVFSTEGVITLQSGQEVGNSFSALVDTEVYRLEDVESDATFWTNTGSGDCDQGDAGANGACTATGSAVNTVMVLRDQDSDEQTSDATVSATERRAAGFPFSSNDKATLVLNPQNSAEEEKLVNAEQSRFCIGVNKNTLTTAIDFDQPQLFGLFYDEDENIHDAAGSEFEPTVKSDHTGEMRIAEVIDGGGRPYANIGFMTELYTQHSIDGVDETDELGSITIDYTLAKIIYGQGAPGTASECARSQNVGTDVVCGCDTDTEDYIYQ